MSARPSMWASPVACSGLMYAGVPNDNPDCVRRLPLAFDTASAIPKSATIGCPCYRRMLSGCVSAHGRCDTALSHIRQAIAETLP